eukprot:CAMPEP_0198221452 /NCGR_PEP_ID=MMETSP1445-20131203/83826_1 /TAXON_ID=36898 /ORGANISM="Pyramimonas sp., Strain CCMP2087" /LENGTH=186 /DNA_ID=CAMNT_0043899627 /DNA_START=89 /DNA_END=645 /DNA_ORIENTATION=-
MYLPPDAALKAVAKAESFEQAATQRANAALASLEGAKNSVSQSELDEVTAVKEEENAKLEVEDSVDDQVVVEGCTEMLRDMVRLHNARKERVLKRVAECATQAKQAAANVQARRKAILVAKQAELAADDAHEQANSRKAAAMAAVAKAKAAVAEALAGEIQDHLHSASSLALYNSAVNRNALVQSV